MCARLFSGTRRLRAAATAVRPPARKVSNHNFEVDPIVPVFWREKEVVAPQKYIIDTTNENMMDGPKGNHQLARRMRKVFDEVGLVLLRGNREMGNNLEAMKLWAEFIFPSLSQYEAGANARKGIIPNVYEIGAPKEAWLHFHHEMAYVNESVNGIAFCCREAIEDPQDPLRGATFVSENFGATDDILATEFGQKLKNKGICYIRCLTNKERYKNMDGVYNHWQYSFMTDCPKEAEKRAIAKGLEVEWGENGYMKTKCYISGFEYHPASKRNLLYSAIADHSCWFDQWPTVMEKPYMKTFDGATEEERPLAITFGDDSEMTREELQLFVDVYENHGIPLAWEKGDIAAICNYRFAHGRLPYDLADGEQRELGVILGQMYKRLGQKDDAW